jgi:hypothetical protein
MPRGNPKLDAMSEQELARYYEEHRDDPSLWDWKRARRISARRGRGPSTVFSVRLTPEELTEIHRAANSSGANASDFMREAALERARNSDAE